MKLRGNMKECQNLGYLDCTARDYQKSKKTFLQYKLKITLLFLLLTFAACKDELMHNLSEYEANKLITSLDQIEIEAEKSKQADGKWTLSVASKSTVPALTHLDKLRFFKKNTEASEKQASMLSSREEQKFQFERSLSGSIERTLSTLNGVLDARVHLNLPFADPLFGQRLDLASTGSASVLLVTESSFPNSNLEVASLVAGASGISEKRVSVLISKQENFRGGKQQELELQTETIVENPVTIEQAIVVSDQAEQVLTPFSFKNTTTKNKQLLSMPEQIANGNLDKPGIEPLSGDHKAATRLWTVILGLICFVGLGIKFFYIKKDRQINSFKGIKPHDFTNFVRASTK
ncbi:MAG: hypothetical protein R3A13_04800 [Bdellovibrionota bacterium]